MLYIEKSKKLWELFSDHEDSKTIIRHLIELGTLIEGTSIEEDGDVSHDQPKKINNTKSSEVVIGLRKLLETILNDTKNDNIFSKTPPRLSLADAAYKQLLLLAKLEPINTDDFNTLEDIPPEARLVISTGHQFNIYSLAQYRKTKPRWLNPYTQTPLNQRDIHRIYDSMKKHGFTDEDLDDLKQQDELQNSPLRIDSPLSALPNFSEGQTFPMPNLANGDIPRMHSLRPIDFDSDHYFFPAFPSNGRFTILLLPRILEFFLDQIIADQIWAWARNEFILADGTVSYERMGFYLSRVLDGTESNDGFILYLSLLLSALSFLMKLRSNRPQITLDNQSNSHETGSFNRNRFFDLYITLPMWKKMLEESHDGYLKVVYQNENCKKISEMTITQLNNHCFLEVVYRHSDTLIANKNLFGMLAQYDISVVLETTTDMDRNQHNTKFIFSGHQNNFSEFIRPLIDIIERLEGGKINTVIRQEILELFQPQHQLKELPSLQ